jgi:hypothetical protein
VKDDRIKNVIEENLYKLPFIVNDARERDRHDRRSESAMNEYA